MFITNTTFKSPVSGILGNSDEQYWSVTELALQQPWFLVNMRQTESLNGANAYAITRTFLSSDVKDLERWLREGTQASLQLTSVQVVTPGSVNGTGAWQMDALKAVWTAEAPDLTGHAIDIFETMTGEKYSGTNLEMPITELQNETLRFCLPSLESIQGMTTH